MHCLIPDVLCHVNEQRQPETPGRSFEGLKALRSRGSGNIQKFDHDWSYNDYWSAFVCKGDSVSIYFSPSKLCTGQSWSNLQKRQFFHSQTDCIFLKRIKAVKFLI